MLAMDSATELDIFLPFSLPYNIFVKLSFVKYLLLLTKDWFFSGRNLNFFI